MTTLAAGLLMLALAGCGDEEPTTADEPSNTPSTSSSSTPSGDTPTDNGTDSTGEDGPAHFELVEIVSATAAGGTVQTKPTQLGGAGKVDKFVAAFEGDELPKEVRDAVKSVRTAPDEGLFAAVVAIGCDVPHDITLERTAGELVVEPVIKKTAVECFAPVTSVAVFTTATGT